MKTLLVVGSLVLLTLVGNILLLLRQPPKVMVPMVRTEPVNLPPRMAPPPPTVDARPQIQKIVAEMRPELRTPRDVSRYLDDLKAQARRNRAVTALEVETGVAAIRELDPENLIRVQEYRQEMARLSAEFEHRDLNADNRPAGLPQPPSLN